MDSDDGHFVYVPTHHQRIARERTSLADVSSFFQFPDRVQRYISRDLQQDDAFQAQYVILYTYDRSVYTQYSDAVHERLRMRWYGELVVFRRGYAGGNLVGMEVRRGDTKNVIWKVIEK